MKRRVKDGEIRVILHYGRKGFKGVPRKEVVQLAYDAMKDLRDLRARMKR